MIIHRIRLATFLQLKSKQYHISNLHLFFNRIIFYGCLLFIVGCGSGKKMTVVKLQKDDTFAHQWSNQTDYEEKQDYVKNLDFSLLEDEEAHPKLKELLQVIKLIIDGEGLMVIPKIQEILNQTEHPTLRRVYLDFVYELLVHADKFQAVVENFPDRLEQRKEVLLFSQFPSEKYEQAAKPVTPQKLEKMKFGLFAVNVELNGEKMMGFFDTGAELSHMPKSVAKRLDVQFDTTNVISLYTVNSKDVHAYPGYIKEIKVGDVIVKNHPVVIFEDINERLGTEDNNIMFNFTLGWPLIKHLRFELDFARQKYRATLSEDQPTTNNTMFWLGYAGLKVNADNGQSLIFALDTGSADTELKTNIHNKMKFDKIVEEEVGIGGHGGLEMLTLPKVNDVVLHLSGQKIHFKEIYIRKNLDFNFIHQDGTIGADIFKQNLFVIDFRNGIFQIK